MTNHTNRGGHQPPAEVTDRPEQNVGYDEAVKGAPLNADEKRRSQDDSPVAAGDNRRAGDEDGNRAAGNPKAKGPKNPEVE